MRCRALNDLRVARLLKKKPKGNAPKLIQQAMDACAQIVTAREKFPELGSGKGQRRFRFTGNRERHLRRLESYVLVLRSMLSHMDLVTQRVGRRRRDGSCDAVRTTRPKDPSVRGRNEPASIQLETGLNHATLARVIADLNDAGYVTTHWRAEEYSDKETGEKKWRGFAAIHQITKTCFSRLGIDLEWLRQQGARAQQREETGPAPLVDVRLRREQRKVIRAQARAAKRAHAPRRPTEQEAAAALRQLAARQRRQE